MSDKIRKSQFWMTLKKKRKIKFKTKKVLIFKNIKDVYCMAFFFFNGIWLFEKINLLQINTSIFNIFFTIY